jgi:hypothetical protein
LNLKFIKLSIAILITGMITVSCSTGTPSTTTKPTPVPSTSPGLGSLVDAKFVEGFEPIPAAGQKIVFISTSPGAEPRETSTEIIAVDGEVLTVRVTTPEGTKELKGKNEDFGDDLPKTGIQYLGKEEVNVPAGDYKAATKVSYTNAENIKVVMWLVQDIGPVKRVDTQPDGSVITTELKEFKN